MKLADYTWQAEEDTVFFFEKKSTEKATIWHWRKCSDKKYPGCGVWTFFSKKERKLYCENSSIVREEGNLFVKLKSKFPFSYLKVQILKSISLMKMIAPWNPKIYHSRICNFKMPLIHVHVKMLKHPSLSYFYEIMPEDFNYNTDFLSCLDDHHSSMTSKLGTKK